MKKKVIALLLCLVLASGSIGNVQVLAADTTGQEAEPVQEEETNEQVEEPVQEEGPAEESDTGNAAEEVREPDDEAEPVQENEAQTQEDEDLEIEESVDEEEADTAEEAAADVLETEETEITDESEDALANVVDSGSCGENATWTLTGAENDLTLTISGSGKMESFSESSIPWASKRAKIKTVVVEDGITSVGSYAFYSLNKLTDVSLPNSITYIGYSGFESCVSLKTITIPDSITSLGEEAFSGCSSLTNITIPESVRYIDEDTFRNCSSLTSITIPTSVTYIGYDAFDDCDQLSKIYISDLGAWCGIRFYDYVPGNLYLDGKLLTEVTIPDEITKIGSFPLRGRDSIKSVTIHESVKSIESDAFDGCGQLNKIYINDLGAWCRIDFDDYVPGDLYLDGKLLTEITIPDGITAIDSYAFSRRDSIKNVTIPDSVTRIGSYAFEDCSSLTSITIPDSVTSIGESAFSGCSSLTSIMMPESMTSIGSNAFENCSSLTSITIPKGISLIDDYTFLYCSSLESIAIPDSVTRIGNYGTYIDGSSESPFAGCKKLKKINISDIGAWCRIKFTDYVPGDLYLDGELLTEVTIPDGITEINWCDFQGRESIKSITIPSSVTTIRDDTFSGCIGLTSITIPDSVKSIGEDAFWGCSSLTSIIIPDSVMSIGYWAFHGCSSLTSVTISNSVTSIGYHTFSGCSSLKSIIIPGSVTSIGECAFKNCSNLESITIPSSVTHIGGMGDPDYYEGYDDDTFEGCDKLNKIYISDLDAWCRIDFDDYVPGDLYLDGKLLTEITIPDGITAIDSYAFSRRDSIKNVTIPDSVTSIGYDAFRDCSNLTSIIIPGSVETIGSCFSDCDNLKSVTILNGVTSIDSYAFSGLSNLTSITIPDSVTSIGSYAFYNCSSLTSISILNSVTSIGDEAFYGCDSLKSLTIPNSVTYIANWAFPRRYWESDNDFIIFTQSQGVKDFCKEYGYAYFDKTAPSIAKLTSHNGSDIRVYFEKRDEATEDNYLFENECVLGYQIKYADNKSMTGAKSIMLKDKKAASKVITGLKNGKTYYVQIQHYLKSGKVSYWSKWSPVKSITVGQTPYNTNVSKLSTYIGSHIKVDWTKTAGASGYHIKYADNSSMTGAKEVFVKGNSTFTKTLTGLKNGKTYYVKIQTYRTVSGKTYWSSWSPAKSIKVDQIPYGSSIKKLTQESATKMKITWDKAPSASGYHIQYRWYDGNKGKYVTKDIIINGNGTVSKTITGLKKNEDYYVRIQTFRKISGKTYWSSWSKEKDIYLWTW